MGLSGVSINYDRLEVVDFTCPYHYSPITFVTKSPKVIENAKLIVHTFPLNIWILIIISYIMVCITLKFVYKLRNVCLITISPLLSQSKNCYI